MSHDHEHHHHHHLHFPDHHGDVDGAEETAGPPLTWDLDNVELVTVGVDVGSSTSHLVFSRLRLQRLAQSLSSRFVVVARETLHRSEILLTPFGEGRRIDVEALQAFVSGAYADAGLSPGDVDTGAVILTGVALERVNARAVAELFADSGGAFVCASAGDSLEAILAAHGSGAVARSQDLGDRRIHVDIGGGTSKLALLDAGEIVSTMAVRAGGRLVATDEGGRVVRVEAGALQHGVDVRLGAVITAADRRRLAERLASEIVGALAEMGAGPGVPVTCSGGVAEYVLGDETRGFGDLAPELAAAFAAQSAERGMVIEEIPGGERIRATAIGASQFTVQLSGNTVHISDATLLPLRNLPVIRVRVPPSEPLPAAVAESVTRGMRRLDIDVREAPCALSVSWSGEPRHRSLLALARGLAEGMGGAIAAGQPLVLALDADLARSLGAILRDELGLSGPIVCVDGLELAELDYVDLGEVLSPAGVVPVVIKSLAFPLALEPAVEPMGARPG